MGIKATNKFNGALGQSDPLGPLDKPHEKHACPPMQCWAEEMQRAVGQQMGIIAEITSEAATTLISDPKDGLGLIDVAQLFYQEDCPLTDRRKALAIFQATAERLRER